MSRSIKLKEQARSFVELMANPNVDKRDSTLAKRIGVAPATIRNWKRRPDLTSEIETTVRDYSDQRLPEIWESLIQQAIEGDVNAARLIFQLRGELDKKQKPKQDFCPPAVEVAFIPARPRTIVQKG
jgi:hypothetical protein